MIPVAFPDIRDEVTRILCELIRIDTTNPPGNETQAAKYVSDQLANDGLESELYESLPKRGNVISRMKGKGNRPSLLLLSHLDVVPAEPSEWSVNPFEGVVKDGFVWGRGALDMKGMTAIEIMTMKLLKRNNIGLEGDVVLAATADEEKGGKLGADFLLKEHRSKIFADYILNEGGGASFPISGKHVYAVQAAEKGLLWLKITTKGKTGHGSMPNNDDNSIILMTRVIERLRQYNPQIKITASVRKLIKTVAKEDKKTGSILKHLFDKPQQSEEILNEIPKEREYLKDEIIPRIKMTITPTVIRGGIKENVIPSECEAIFDCRMLPGQSTRQALEIIKNLLHDFESNKISIEVIQRNEPSESPLKTPLYYAIVGALKRVEPNSQVIPWLMTGSTDSRFFREKGSICYGFHPLKTEEPLKGKIIRREHGADERISIDNLVFGTSVLYQTVKNFMN